MVNPALPNDWHYVYLLNSNNPPSSYVGCTNDLKERLKEHNKGRVYSTKKMLPVELVYYEAYRSKECAYKREKSLKAFGNGLSRIKSRIGIKRKEGRGEEKS